MTASALKPSPEDRDRAYRSRLKDEPSPAVIIDCASAVVLAANAGGLNALGLTPATRLPAPLDSAMPAVSRLRDFYNRGFGATARHTLIFWRHGRTSTRTCDISAADHGYASHALIVFREDGDPSPPPAATLDTFEAALAANDDSPPPIARDDSETLKEIARRIRDGQSRLRAEIRQDSTGQDGTEHDLPVAAIGGIKEIDDQTEKPVAPRTNWDQPIVPAVASTSIVEAAPAQTAAPIASQPVDSAPMQPPAGDNQHDTPALTPAPPAPDRTARTDSHRPRDVMRALPPEDIAKLAHELKTPLSAIAAAAEIMRDEQLGAMGNPRYLGYAADIHESATHALAVISDMLAAVPISGSRASTKHAFDLSELAARTVSSLQPLAEQRSLTLVLDADGSALPVRANATAVRQILLNLLTNALKFTPSGGDIRVGTGYLDDGAAYLVVRDTGDGMTEEALESAFDDSTDTMAIRAGGGRGIGLRLVRRLAAENGAEFEIDTALGRGTVVLVAFPKDLVGER